jgi:hypothetical protein
MRVLVVESDRGSADAAITELQAAGHHVLRCHEMDLPAFPCNALCDSGTCPLDTAQGVDVVLDHRSHPYPRPTAFEDGVSCALRRHVPLVVTGTSALNPFDRWTTAVAEDDVVGACERAAGTSIENLAAPARDEVRRLLADAPEVAAQADVEVHRAGRVLQVTVHLPVSAEDVDGKIAVTVAGVVRSSDPHASQVNVAVHRHTPLASSGPSAWPH